MYYVQYDKDKPTYKHSVWTLENTLLRERMRVKASNKKM